LNSKLIKIKNDLLLEGKIDWSFTEVSLSQKIDENNLHQYFATDYAGSSHFLSDEGFSFNKDILVLSALSLRVPEKISLYNQAKYLWHHG
jgi:hypothetical protein